MPRIVAVSDRGTSIFDTPRFAEPLRERIRAGAAALAAAHGVQIEHIRQAYIRKEEVVALVLKERGDRSGWMPILSATKACDA